MKCVSFNVNSIRTRLHQLEAVIKKHSPDIIGLQETKVIDDEFPVEQIHDLGYHLEVFGQKTHYGVALLSKKTPVNCIKGFDHDAADAQRRFIACQYTNNEGLPFWVLNGYFPQGESRDHPEKFPNKQRFYENLQDFLVTHHKATENLIVMGDLNVAPNDKDVGIGEDNQKRWLKSGKCSFLPEERLWFDKLCQWGLTDCYRHIFAEADNEFSWFDYRSRGFELEPKRGLRIDFILASETLAKRCTGSGIDYDIRGMEKPSDHCPVWAEFSF